jgi:translation initiation factor SUI1
MAFIDVRIELENEFKNSVKDTTHIFVNQRSSKKYITIIENLPENIELIELLSIFTKKFNCGGSMTKDEKGNKVIILQGNQKENVRNFLIEKNIKKDDEIHIHSF